jgi:SAM-dependent methyltransferase
MNNNHLTDLDHWNEYWSNYQYDKVPKKVVFSKFTERLSKGKSLIEIGGFPGINAGYFYNKGVKDISILDFHMNTNIVRKFELFNQIPQDTIKCIHSDFFKFTPSRTYDIVFSCGFAEHFHNTEETIQRHIDLLSKEGQLLILIPNFLGLNGALQRRFDKPNLDAHNLKSMQPDFLKEIMQKSGLKNYSVEYVGKPMVWLEPKSENMKYLKSVKLLSYFIKLFPIKGRFLSPYIAIYASK